jgi:5-methylcytosine-specific restriction endonuclease McrA
VIGLRFGGWKKALLVASGESERETAKQSRGTARPRKGISPRTRFIIFKRDLYTCRICRRSGVELALDHIIPVSRGGSDAMDNLQVLCVICNQGKAGSLQ